jgi:hypothetical protein
MFKKSEIPQVELSYRLSRRDKYLFYPERTTAQEPIVIHRRHKPIKSGTIPLTFSSRPHPEICGFLPVEGNGGRRDGRHSGKIIWARIPAVSF